MTIPRRGGFPVWRVVAGILQNFLHLRVHENVFDKNPQQPTTPSNPPQAAGEFLFLREAIPGPGCTRTAGGGMLARFRLFQQFI